MPRLKFALFALASAAQAACAQGGSADMNPGAAAGAASTNGTIIAQAAGELRDPKGAPAGLVTLTEHPGGVLVRGELWGLTPGWHGVHIHETGACRPNFEAAGGHFAPYGAPHGLQAGGPHAADLPNFFAGDDGMARFEALTTRFSLAGPARVAAAGGASARPGLFDEDGAAIVVHAEPDDYVSEPAGDSGARIACGVIVRR